jgi:hypothetical protein
MTEPTITAVTARRHGPRRPGYGPVGSCRPPRQPAAGPAARRPTVPDPRLRQPALRRPRPATAGSQAGRRTRLHHVQGQARPRHTRRRCHRHRRGTRRRRRRRDRHGRLQPKPCRSPTPSNGRAGSPTWACTGSKSRSPPTTPMPKPGCARPPPSRSRPGRTGAAPATPRCTSPPRRPIWPCWMRCGSAASADGLGRTRHRHLLSPLLAGAEECDVGQCP